jgi:hypothetical protein
LDHGAIDGLSIGFFARGYREDEDKTRTLTDIELVEISVVEEPADNAARISDIKSAIEEAESIREIEALLRDAAGFSRRDAAATISRIKALSGVGHPAKNEPEMTDKLSEMKGLIDRFAAKL